MKKINEKVKDIVDVRVYESLNDFMADPARTLANYHFTDATSELMAKWLDKVVAVKQGAGAACALAGYRGVGKSHFLAALSAIVSRPELRSSISDSHVSAGSERLMRRHYPVAYIRRGTGATLFDEFRTAVSVSIGVQASELGNSFADVLRLAAIKAGDLPFLLMVDTAFERGSRVARDDGPFLAEIAESAKSLNVFLGVVLDDDIAGADGSNSGIARSYTIDYLDQEHLYKVVNSHVFPKHGQMQSVLQDIYSYFREVLPDFRWSEQRFASLYPLHPAILEVAPFVRLYVHDFALLGFASAAAERIMGRPANSLIALDEVFDSAEKGLRKIDDLKDAFDAYDKLNSGIVAKIPVMQRLQAKLVLKALLLLSLDGQGATAGQIAASMLIFDEADPHRAGKTVEDLLRSFANELPNDVRVSADEGRGVRYGFTVSSKDNLNQSLDERVRNLGANVVSLIHLRYLEERFSDCSFREADGEQRWMECGIHWRGSIRPGRINWLPGNNSVESSPLDPSADWNVTISLDIEPNRGDLKPSGVPNILWKPDALRVDEIDTLLRHYVLSTDSSLREEFTEEVRASLHSHSVASERIMNRVFLEDGKLVIDGFDYNCTEEARVATTLAELFSVMLEPLFEGRFPSHPVFPRLLGMEEVEKLTTGMFSGDKQNLPEIQSLAAAFAMPLGLVKELNGSYVPEPDEKIADLPPARIVLGLIDGSGNAPVSLDSVNAELRKEPFGLAREAQRLILTALVSSRQIEFVTSRGDRINRRSLDLKIIWDDVVGISRPAEASYSVEKLTRWARIVSGDKGIKSLDSSTDRKKVETAFASWLNEWRTSRVLERFGQLPDALLNTSIWRLSADCSKTLGSAAINLSSFIDGSIALEECLDRIADTFADSEDNFAEALSRLAVLDSFISGVGLREEILSYVVVAEFTGVDDIEDTRAQLFHAIDESYFNPSEATNRELGYLWIKFQRDYSERFAECHRRSPGSPETKQRVDSLLQSDKWWEFESLSRTPLFDGRFWTEARSARGDLDKLSCQAAVEEILTLQPFCRCGFSLSDTQPTDPLTRLKHIVDEGLRSYRTTLARKESEFRPVLELLASYTADQNESAALDALSRSLTKGPALPAFSAVELNAIQWAARKIAENTRPPEPTAGKAKQNLLTTEEESTFETKEDGVLLNL